MEGNKLELNDLLKNAPKEFDIDYLRQLRLVLDNQTVERNQDVEDIANSLLLLILKESTASQDRKLAVSILNLMPTIPDLSELLLSANITQLIYALPVLSTECIGIEEKNEVIKKLCRSVCHDDLNVEEQRSLLTFLAKIVYTENNPLSREEIKEILNILPIWMRNVVSPRVKKPIRLKRSSSILSLTDVDGNKDFFTTINYSKLSSSDQILDIQIFSMLRIWLLDPNRNISIGGKVPVPPLADLISEELSFTVREYCFHMVDQANKKTVSPGVTDMQKTCLMESIALLDVICYVDSSVVHSVLATVKRIYKEISSTILERPSAKDVAVVVGAMQFFINHGSAVMYKHDSLYPFLFCDLLSVCYQDPVATAEILLLTRKNLAQLCYHSSIMERYFPTFFKTLAWSPTFLSDFMQLLPAFMSQHTSLEVFHTLLDLPCLTAILSIINHQPDLIDDGASSLEIITFAKLKSLENKQILNFFLRKSSSVGDVFVKVGLLHQLLKPFVSYPKVKSCAEICVPLLKCFFSTFLQYADASAIFLFIPTLLERISVIFPIKGYVEQIHEVFAEGLFQMLKKHPVSVFHCKDKIVDHLHNLKNYYISTNCYTNLVWSVGEFVSLKCSDSCASDVITLYFETIEPIIYETINTLSCTANDRCLHLISTSCSTLAALSVRSQDLMPRAVLCLSKVHSQLVLYDTSYIITWRITEERVMELISILNTPKIASVILDPSKDIEYGKLHRDATSLPFVLRAVTSLLDVKT